MEKKEKEKKEKEKKESVFLRSRRAEYIPTLSDFVIKNLNNINIMFCF